MAASRGIRMNMYQLMLAFISDNVAMFFLLVAGFGTLLIMLSLVLCEYRCQKTKRQLTWKAYQELRKNNLHNKYKEMK